VHAFVLSPRIVRTCLLIEAKAGGPLDTVALLVATTLYLTSGCADWLSRRSVATPVYITTHVHALPGTIPQIGTSQRWSATGRMRSSRRKLTQ
jgi:hypothetical protein